MAQRTAPIGADADWSETLDRLRRFVASRVGDPQVAEDITQDVIVRSIAAGALDRVDNPIGWLIRSASNAVIDHHRTARRHETIDDHDGGRWDDHLLADHDAADTMAQLTRCIQPLVAHLAPVYRDAITWVDLEGRTQAEAATAAGVSLSGMKSRVQRARRQLKGLITSCCEVEVDRRGGPTDMRPRTSCGCSAAG